MVSVAPSRPIRYVPNALSALRLVIAFSFAFIEPGWRLAAVVVGGLTDFLDGVIARKFNAGSTAGAILDAIADKAFVLAVLVTLSVAGDIQWWQAVLVMTRDLAVALVAIYAAIKMDWPAFARMRPRLAGKATTLLMFAWFIALLWEPLQSIELAIFIAAAACSATAAVDYLARFALALRKT